VTSGFYEPVAGTLTVTAPWRAGWGRVVLASVMLLSIGVLAGATGALAQVMGLHVQSLDALSPPWIRALAGAAMLILGAYLGVLATRPFLAVAKQVGLVPVTISMLVGAQVVVPAVRVLLAERRTSLALAAMLGGMWLVCFTSTLVRPSIWLRDDREAAQQGAEADER
jgi:hypothetical protein